MPDFLNFLTVRVAYADGYRGPKDAIFVGEKIARALWIDQRISIRGAMCPVRRRERRCSRCIQLDRQLCLVMNCRLGDFQFFTLRCGGCVRSGVSCNDVGEEEVVGDMSC